MITEKITLMVHAAVQGPTGIKLKPGTVVALDDSPYVRILIKSGRVSLIDPPSLDEEYLVRAGLMKEEPKVEEPKVEEPKVEEPKAEAPKAEEPKVEAPKQPEVRKTVPSIKDLSAKVLEAEDPSTE